MKIQNYGGMAIRLARKKLNAGENYNLKSIESDNNGLLITLVAPRIDKFIYVNVFLKKSEIIEFCKTYEKETGFCYACEGAGKILKSWNQKGYSFKKCGRCAGTGRLQNKLSEEKNGINS